MNPLNFLTLATLLGLGACTPGTAVATCDEDECNGDTGGDNAETVDDGNGDNSTNEGDYEDDYDDDTNPTSGDLVLYVGTPGGLQVGTMFVNIEPLTDLDVEFGDWSIPSLRYAWVYGVTLNLNPGPVEGVRYNATYCSSEVADEDDPSCTSWLAYGQDESESHLTAPTSVTYLGQSYDVDTVVVEWYEDGVWYRGSSAISVFDD